MRHLEGLVILLKKESSFVEKQSRIVQGWFGEIIASRNPDPFILPATWNVDMTAIVPAAMLDHNSLNF